MSQLVGIINLTPDSFSDGGVYADAATALSRVAQLFRDGAAIVDIGAESTRPGADPLTTDEERARLEPILPTLMEQYEGQLSLDTYHPETADWALGLGSIIINDVTGMRNPRMIEVISRHGAQCIVSHLPTDDVQSAHHGEPISDMQVVIDDLLATESLLRAEGLDAEDIILDPGIGFGKTPELNRELLEFARYVPDKSVMIGYSRKRFLGEDRMELAPNLAAGRIALAAGASYLRVHDVAGHQALYTKGNV